ncbi:MAG: hypothetical protein V4819_22350 [Verrucomicrobiota bacterium]
MITTYKTLLALTLAVSVTLCPAASNPAEAAPSIQEEKSKLETYSTKVIFEMHGKEIGSYTAYTVADSSGEFHCVGTADMSVGLWRVNFQAEMTSKEYPFVSIEVEDLKLLKKNPEGLAQPMSVFKTRLQSKGVGKYNFGEVQRVTVRVEISTAEQAAP